MDNRTRFLKLDKLSTRHHRLAMAYHKQRHKAADRHDWLMFNELSNKVHYHNDRSWAFYQAANEVYKTF